MVEVSEEFIDNNRIYYPESENGVRIDGSAFIVEFDEPLSDTEAFLDEVFTPELPFCMFGLYHSIHSEEPYFSVHATSLPVVEEEDEPITDEQRQTEVGKIDCEVCPEWMRIYIKGDDLAAGRVVAFLEEIDKRYPLSLRE